MNMQGPPYAASGLLLYSDARRRIFSYIFYVNRLFSFIKGEGRMLSFIKIRVTNPLITHWYHMPSPEYIHLNSFRLEYIYPYVGLISRTHIHTHII